MAPEATRKGHAAIAGRGATAIIPLRKSGRLWKEDWSRRNGKERDPASLKALRAGLSRTRLTGLQARRRVKAQMRRPKAFGEGIVSRNPDRQAAEIHIRIALMNRLEALGQARIARIA